MRAAEPGRPYLILLSYLPLRGFRDFVAFAGHDRRISRQLDEARHGWGDRWSASVDDDIG